MIRQGVDALADHGGGPDAPGSRPCAQLQAAAALAAVGTEAIVFRIWDAIW